MNAAGNSVFSEDQDNVEMTDDWNSNDLISLIILEKLEDEVRIEEEHFNRVKKDAKLDVEVEDFKRDAQENKKDDDELMSVLFAGGEQAEGVLQGSAGLSVCPGVCGGQQLVLRGGEHAPQVPVRQLMCESWGARQGARQACRGKEPPALQKQAPPDGAAGQEHDGERRKCIKKGRTNKRQQELSQKQDTLITRSG